MNIGFDFDNTIIDYSGIFYEIARLKNLIPDNIQTTKTSVRNYLLGINKEDEFTKLQGLIYGKEILRAKPYKNIIEILNHLKKLNHNIFIVSHKTKYPYLGEKINLRDAADKWIKNYLKIDDKLIFDKKNIFYEDTIDSKIKRINQLEINYFIDDLPSVLKLIENPTIGLLYDPSKKCIYDKNKTINNHLELIDILG